MGFRPFVYQRAQHYGLVGWVSNRTDGVRVVVNASETVLDALVHDLLHHHPPVARITGHSVRVLPTQAFDDFSIIHSQTTDATNVLLTPDLALCPACRQELSDPTDRRHRYAFTTCTHCGPRYSIVRALPYDRATTTMAPFGLCPDCQREYDDPTHRRYYAQTNTCPACPITLALYRPDQTLVTDDQTEIISQVTEKLRAGATVAVKGVGGYLLLCDAANPEAIARLRERKQRPTKPLALMYPSMVMLLQDTTLRPAARAALTSPVAPVVLLPMTDAVRQRVAFELIAPQLEQFGVMLPYAPLFEVLTQEMDRPLVATSGNVSGSPIVYTEATAQTQLAALADYRLTYDRDIVVPQDDSVVRYSPEAQQRIVLRRSRGLAPTYVTTSLALPGACVLAMGGQLKSTFSYTHDGHVYVSQYLGDLDSYDAQENYRRVLRHLLTLFRTQPTVILTDRHPQYATNQYGQQLADEYAVPRVSVSHHEAHLAAVLGEHDLVDTEAPVLGVVWDGTGLGNDGQVWGGEFFTYQQHTIRRAHHVAYFRHLLGDKMAREPRLSALSLTHHRADATVHLRPRFTEPEWQYYTRQLRSEGLWTSSVGRLFDAVACLLGLLDQTSYEGEAALRVETLARRYVQQHGHHKLVSYFPDAAVSRSIPTQPLLTGILADLRWLPVEKIAARFHYSLAQLIHTVAQQHEIKKVAFSGGVFQNAVLVDMIHRRMSTDYDLYFHQQLSPNDENISFGQLIHYQMQQKAKSVKSTRRTELVVS